MTISCSCDFDGDYHDYDWWWEGHSKVLVMPHFNRRKRCCSCEKLINPGEDVFKFFRFRGAKSIIEESIHGDEVPFTSVEDLGMCYSLNEPINDQIAEYMEADRELKEYMKANPEEEDVLIDDFFH